MKKKTRTLRLRDINELQVGAVILASVLTILIMSTALSVVTATSQLLAS